MFFNDLEVSSNGNYIWAVVTNNDSSKTVYKWSLSDSVWTAATYDLTTVAGVLATFESLYVTLPTEIVTTSPTLPDMTLLIAIKDILLKQLTIVLLFL